MEKITFEEQVSEYLDAWFEDQSEEYQQSILDDLEVEMDEDLEDDEKYVLFESLEIETKYKVFDLGYGELDNKEDFLASVFKKAAGKYLNNLSFSDEFISDMVSHSVDYDSPLGFFNDFSYGGCVSGMIGILIYNPDCKKIYVEHIDDMETFKEDLEDELGEPISNIHSAPHYTFMCWLCYEELAFRIARTLFPEEF